MELNQRKEQFSRAFVRAIAAVGGFQVSTPEIDDDSIDLTFATGKHADFPQRPKLDAQLKCTSRPIIHDEVFSFELKKKNYEDLRQKDLCTPRLLIVVTVPESIDEWVGHNENEMILRHGAHWMSIRGMDETTNRTSVTIQVPIANRFTVDSLQRIMKSISNGEMP